MSGNMNSNNISNMFEDGKKALLNGVNSMNIKSPKISRHAPPFIHAVVSSRRRNQTQGSRHAIHWVVIAVLAILGLLLMLLFKIRSS